MNMQRPRRKGQALLAAAPVLLLLAPPLLTRLGGSTGEKPASGTEAQSIRARSLAPCRALLPPDDARRLTVAQIEAEGPYHHGGVRHWLVECGGSDAPRQPHLIWNAATGALIRASVYHATARQAPADSLMMDAPEAEAAAQRWLKTLLPPAQQARWRREGSATRTGLTWTVRLRAEGQLALVQVWADTGELTLLSLTRDRK